MTLEFLRAEMIKSFKEGNKFRKETISDLIAAINKEAIDKKTKDNITEELVDAVILKEKKILQEMIDTCPPGRGEILSHYNIKMAVIKEFAPKILETREEISEFINEIIFNKPNITIKEIMPMLKGKVNMKLANQIVKEKLSC